MLNRVVSLCSLLVVIASVAFFILGAYWILMGRMDEMDGVFALAGWLVSAVFFSYRSADPAWLEPVSIVRR